MVKVAPADEFGDAKRATARYFFARILPRCHGLELSICSDGDAVMALPGELF
jgi:hypothetical protein